jgi:hypothetical protein
MLFTVFWDSHLLMSWTFPFTGFHRRKLLVLDGGVRPRRYRAIHLHRRLLRPCCDWPRRRTVKILNEPPPSFWTGCDWIPSKGSPKARER